MKSGYSHVKDTFEKHETGYKTTHWERGIEYRKGRSIERVEKPIPNTKIATIQNIFIRITPSMYAII